MIRPHATRRVNNYEYYPTNLRNYAGVFVGGFIEDYRLVKLSLLLEDPRGKRKDLEDKVKQRAGALTDRKREMLTKDVYQELWKIARGIFMNKKTVRPRSQSILIKAGLEDLLECVVLEAIKYVKAYKAKGPFFNWYLTILINMFVDAARARYTKIPTFTDLNKEDGEGIQGYIPVNRTELHARMQNPEAKIISDEGVKKIEDIINSLDRRKKKILLYAAKGLTYGDIAKRTGGTEDGVRKMLFRVRQSLLAKL